jgi:hypothetical protein
MNISTTASHQYKNEKSGYYTVHVDMGGQKIPYIVFAASDYHAARLVKDETGCLVTQHDVEGPHARF